MIEEELKEIIKIEKKEEFKEEDLSSKIKEFLESEKNDFPTFALTSMIMDSFVSGATIFKVRREVISSEPLQENFEIMN